MVLIPRCYTIHAVEALRVHKRRVYSWARIGCYRTSESRRHHKYAEPQVEHLADKESTDFSLYEISINGFS
jgi:hypothetical protein